MNSNQDTALKAGAFVIVAGFLLIGAVIVLGQREQLWTTQYPLRAQFENARGLIPGAAVRVGGVVAGNVDTVSLVRLQTGWTVVRVALKVGEAYSPFVCADSVATIRTLGPLGDKYIEISLGSAQSPILKPGMDLKTEEPADLFEIADKMSAALGRVNEFVEGLTQTVVDFQQTNILTEAAKATASLRKLVESIEKGPGLAHTVLFDPQAPKIVDDLRKSAEIFRQAAEDTRAGKGNLGALLYGEKLAKATDDLAEASAAIRRVLKEVESGQGLAHALLYEEKPRQILDDISAAARSAGNVLQAVEKGEGMAHALVYDAKPREALDNLALASAQLTRIFADVERGKGTLGLLIADPAIWESLVRLLGGAEESRVLKYLVRSAAREEPPKETRGAKD